MHDRGTGPPGFLFPSIPEPERAEGLAGHLDARGHLGFVFSSVVVRTPRHVAVLDVGPATGGPAGVRAGLTRLGAGPDDVDLVVVSHAHEDHVGGLTEHGRPVFGLARHVVAPAEVAATPRPFREVAAAGLLDRDAGPEPLRGLRIVPAPGHTPGHQAVEIGAGGDSILYMADALAHEANVARPRWNHFSDASGPAAARSRHRLLRRAAATGSVVIASHVPRVGRIRRTTDGFRFEPVRAGREAGPR